MTGKELKKWLKVRGSRLSPWAKLYLTVIANNLIKEQTP